MQASYIPNIITVFRFVLVPPVVISLLDGSYLTALYLFAVAGLSDAVDGILARHYGWTSRLGSILDPLADKSLQIAAYITLAYLGVLPVWLSVLVLARDVTIVSGALAVHLRHGRFEMEPHGISKANTLLQIMLVLLVIVEQAFHLFPSWVISVLIYSVVVTTLISGVFYVIIWGRRYFREEKQVP